MIEYWKLENHKTKQVKSKKQNVKSKSVSYYDILTGPQKWMLLSAYQKMSSGDTTPSTLPEIDEDENPIECSVISPYQNFFSEQLYRAKFLNPGTGEIVCCFFRKKTYMVWAQADSWCAGAEAAPWGSTDTCVEHLPLWHCLVPGICPSTELSSLCNRHLPRQGKYHNRHLFFHGCPRCPWRVDLPNSLHCLRPFR